MRRRRQEIALLALALLVSNFTPHDAAALGDTPVTAADCSIAAARDVINNKITCNFGLTPEQVQELIKAAAGPLTDRIVELSKQLGKH